MTKLTEIERLREDLATVMAALDNYISKYLDEQERIATLESALREVAGHFETLTIVKSPVSALATKALATINKALREQE